MVQDTISREMIKLAEADTADCTAEPISTLLALEGCYTWWPTSSYLSLANHHQSSLWLIATLITSPIAHFW